MGSEMCIRDRLQTKFGDKIGLYRDDGLAFTDTTPRMTENIKKEICRIFKEHSVQITIEANKQVINFLDVMLNLSEKTYCPYTKPGDNLLYVHHESNHPPSITRNILSSDRKPLRPRRTSIPESPQREWIQL